MKYFVLRQVAACVLVVATGVQPVMGASEDHDETLTLQEAIKVALAHNKEKKVSQQKSLLAESKYQEALSARWPTLGFQAGHQYRNNPMTLAIPELNVPLGALGTILQGALAPLPVPTSINVPANEVKLAGNTTNNASINLQYPLYSGGKISSIIEQAEVGKAISQQEVKKTNSKVIYDVKRYYYGVQLTKEMFNVADSTYEMLKYNLKITEKSYQAGDEGVNKLDFYKLQNAVNLANNIRADFEAKHTEAVAALIYSMGLDRGAKVNVSAPLSVSMKEELNIDQLLTEAKQLNPDLNRLKLATKAMDAKVDEMRSEYFPKIGLFASRNYQDLNVNGGLNTSDNRNNWSIGIGVTMSLFDGGATSNRVNSAKFQKRQLSEQLHLAESGLALLISNKITQFKRAMKQVNVGEQATKDASDHVNLVSRAFAIGAAETKDIIEAAYQKALIKTNMLKAKHDALLSLAEIENSVGDDFVIAE